MLLKKSRIGLFCLLLISKSLAFAQKTDSAARRESIAEFPGGQAAYYRYWNLWLPTRPTSCGAASGRTIILADVSSFGELSAIHLAQSSGCTEHDSICLAAARSMPRWQPHSLNGEALDSRVTMTVSLGQAWNFMPNPRVGRWPELKISFWAPFATILATDKLGSRLGPSFLGGLGVSFEGKKWGIEDVILFGGGRVREPFSLRYDWLEGQRTVRFCLQFGAMRSLKKFEKGSLCAVGGVSFFGARVKNAPKPTAQNELINEEGQSIYLGFLARRVLTKGIWQSENGALCATFSARMSPAALRKVGNGTAFSVVAGLSILGAQTEDRLK